MYRFLTCHSVGHQQDLARLHSSTYAGNLLHHALIDIQTTGCVKDNHGGGLLASIIDRVNADIDGISPRWFSVDWNRDLLPQRLKLANGSWAIHVRGHHDGTLALFTQEVGELGGHG